MQSKFESYIKDNLPFLFKERSIVCCSAGIDSVVLFHLMFSINKNFVVAHCNYKLRADESDLDEKFVIKYLNKIAQVNKNSFSIKVGSRLVSPDQKFCKAKSPFIFHVPRKSLLRAIRSNIFDDLLIGNFAKVLICQNQTENFRNTFKVASKYIDNAGIKNMEELKKFLWVYRNSYDNKLIQIKSEIKVKSRDIILSKLISNKKILGVLKNIYQRF